jgi:glucose/arabinose dehydrogenase
VKSRFADQKRRRLLATIAKVTTSDQSRSRAVVRRGLLLGAVLILATCGVDLPTNDSGSANGQSAPVGEPTPVLPTPELTPASSSSTAALPAAESTSTTSPTATTTTIIAARTIPASPLGSISLDLELVATLTSPVGMAPRPGTDDLFVIEQQGRVVRLPGGNAEGADTTLDLRGEVSNGNEQGLLGLVFSPDGDRLFVNYTDRSGDTQIARFEMAGTSADTATQKILLSIPQPNGNHNGGHLAFGPDGYLYIGMGDGGGGGDPGNNGQNPNTLLGSILRIDVDTAEEYSIPPENPFLGGDAPEVFIWGIRNAWRFGFDSLTGDLWIGDVGQDRFEEVTVLRAEDGGGDGANLGWNEVEGAEPFRSGTIPDEHVAPVITYAQAQGRCSITGGEVYRGSVITNLYGTYLYADFCSGEVFGYRVDGSVEEAGLDIQNVNRPSSFALDNKGEIYVLSRRGGIFRIIAT